MTFDINKADIVDTTHVDAALASIRRNEENARRRATVLTWGKAVLLGRRRRGGGHRRCGAVPPAPEGDRDHEGGREAGHHREAGDRRASEAEVVDMTSRSSLPRSTRRSPQPCRPSVDLRASRHKAPPPPPVPAPTTETHPWDQLADKQYVGIITDVIDGKVCIDHDTAEHHCIQDVEVDETAPRQARP